jgi:hypothetical protein
MTFTYPVGAAGGDQGAGGVGQQQSQAQSQNIVPVARAGEPSPM